MENANAPKMIPSRANASSKRTLRLAPSQSSRPTARYANSSKLPELAIATNFFMALPSLFGSRRGRQHIASQRPEGTKGRRRRKQNHGGQNHKRQTLGPSPHSFLPPSLPATARRAWGEGVCFWLASHLAEARC